MERKKWKLTLIDHLFAASYLLLVLVYGVISYFLWRSNG